MVIPTTSAGAPVSRDALMQSVRAEFDSAVPIVVHKEHDKIAHAVFPISVSIAYWRVRLSIVRDNSEA